MGKQTLPLRFTKKTSTASLLSDVMLALRVSLQNSVPDSIIRTVTETTFFCIKQRLLICGKVTLPKLGLLSVERDRDNKVFVQFFANGELITELYSSLAARCSSLDSDSPF